MILSWRRGEGGRRASQNSYLAAPLRRCESFFLPALLGSTRRSWRSCPSLTLPHGRGGNQIGIARLPLLRALSVSARTILCSDFRLCALCAFARVLERRISPPRAPRLCEIISYSDLGELCAPCERSSLVLIRAANASAGRGWP
jgi:hypothetical protein